MSTDSFADQIEADIQQLDDYSRFNRNIRKTVIDKLLSAVAHMEIDANANKPSEIEAKMNLVNTLLKAIDDSEAQRISLIKIKQSYKRDADTKNAMENISSTVVEYMRQIDSKLDIIKNHDCVEKAEHEKNALLDAAVEVADFEILEDELTLTTTCAKDIEK